MSRIFGRSLRLMLGSRNIVITVALEKSVANRSACVKVASSLTPASFGVAPRQLDHVGIVLDADRAGAALRRGDDGAAVAGAEIHQQVGGPDLREVEHAVDQRLRGRDPDHVLAGLADARLERRLRLGEREAGRDDRDGCEWQRPCE